MMLRFCSIIFAAIFFYVDGVTYPDFASIIATSPSNKTIVITSNYTISASAPISGDNVHFKCEDGAVLTVDPNVMLTINGNGMIWDGCVFTGPGIGINTTPLMYVNTVNGFTFINSTVSGFGYTAQSGIINISNSNDVTFHHDKMFGNGDFDIDINIITPNTGTSNLSITDNSIAVVVMGVGATSERMYNITYANNRMTGGTNAVTDMNCLTLLGGSGVGFADGTFTGNVCKLKNALNTPGSVPYSIGGFARLTFTGNALDTNSFPVQAYGMEFAPVYDSAIDNNTSTVNGGSATLTNIICNGCSDTTINGNIVNGFGTAADAYGILVLNQTPSFSAIGMIANDNSVTFPPGGTGVGIGFVSSNPTAALIDAVAALNSINGANGAGSQGILAGQASGLLAGVQIGPNMIRQVTTGVSVSSGVTYWCSIPGANYAAVPFASSNPPSACH